MSKISISKETLAVLKNFAGFNSNVLIPEGNVIKTITPAKNVMAIATLCSTIRRSSSSIIT